MARVASRAFKLGAAPSLRAAASAVQPSSPILLFSHPSCDPDRWTIQALLDELERRQEPESRHKLKPTKLAGKSLSELRALGWRSISDDTLRSFCRK